MGEGDRNFRFEHVFMTLRHCLFNGDCRLSAGWRSGGWAPNALSLLRFSMLRSKA
jgi:hypothetical protein